MSTDIRYNILAKVQQLEEVLARLDKQLREQQIEYSSVREYKSSV